MFSRIQREEQKTPLSVKLRWFRNSRRRPLFGSYILYEIGINCRSLHKSEEELNRKSLQLLQSAFIIYIYVYLCIYTHIYIRVFYVCFCEIIHINANCYLLYQKSFGKSLHLFLVYLIMSAIEMSGEVSEKYGTKPPAPRQTHRTPPLDRSYNECLAFVWVFLHQNIFSFSFSLFRPTPFSAFIFTHFPAVLRI